MDKLMEEEDLKGLEEEINDAVDRLFVEKKGEVAESFLTEPEPSEPPLKSSLSKPSMKPPASEPLTRSPVLETPVKPFFLEPSDTVDRLFVEEKGEMPESLLMEPEPSEPPLKPSLPKPAMKPPALEPLTESPVLETPVKPSYLEPSYETEKTLERERPLRPPSAPVPFLKSIEQMEAQLLSLEWEITEEKLNNTKKEVVALQELLKHRADIVSILSYMEEALSYMIQDEANIRPPWIKFLLDSKDTIKLLMRKETEGEIDIYKQLAYLGIEARFSCLEGTANTHLIQPSPGGESKAVEKKEISVTVEKKIEGMSDKINRFMERVEEIFGTMERQISRVEETIRKPLALSMEGKSQQMNVTIFRVDEKLFGVETEKIFKLFKVPITFHEKYSDQAKIRLRDLEVKMINLKKIFSIPGEDLPGEMRILTVKDNGEYKGLMVDQVLKKLSTTSEIGGSYGDFFLGRIFFTYEEQPVEIPILDLKKF
jgi:chemotaxis signal transduction protein